MKILVIAAGDATNLSIVNVLKEFENRGHEINIFARFMDSNSIRMFAELKAPIYDAKELNEEFISNYDIAFCGTDAMNILRWANIYVFSYNFIMNSWTTAGADFMFTARKNRTVKYREDCATMAVGVAKNDTPIRVCDNKQILYIDAGHIPFGAKGKEQVANMLINICKEFPDYKLVVKPRWLLEDKKNQTHRNGDHIYNFIDKLSGGDIPENLILLDKHLDLQQLIDESVSVITTSITCYMDAALRDKGVIVVGGLKCEDQFQLRKNVTLKQDYTNAQNAGCVVDYRDVIKYLPEGIRVNKKHIEYMLPTTQKASAHIVDVIEYVYRTFIKYGKYPKIDEYLYESYTTEIKVDNTLNMEKLKYKRMKNAIINDSRMIDFIDADIDVSSYFSELEEIYRTYSLNQDSYLQLQDRMTKKWQEILVANADLLNQDSINQSYLLWALYGLERYEEIINIPPDSILCKGPYHFYLGKIHQKQGEVPEAIYNYEIYIREVNNRAYEKYLQDGNSGIRDAYNYIFQKYNGKNILPNSLAELYIQLYENNNELLVKFDYRRKAHNFLPDIADILKESNPILANKCLDLYVKHERHLNINVLNKKIQRLEADRSRIYNSISYKLGAFLTWIPRKTRKVCRYICSHNIKQIWTSMCEKVNNTFKEQHLYQIFYVFQHKVMLGYNIYSEVIKKYGEQAELVISGPATGDAYLYGMMFETYTKKKESQSLFVFAVYGKSSIPIAKLFKIENVVAYSMEELQAIYNLLMFISQKYINIDSMHYHIFYRHTAILSFLEGLHEFNYFTQSMACLNIELRDSLAIPTFEHDENYIQKLFKDINCIKGKTVVLAPYAKSVKMIPSYFWKRLVERLTVHGFCVCTNSIGEEEPAIGGTNPVFVSYDKSVPFVENAGAVIGIRSGFLDVVSSAKCLKISLCNMNNNRRSLVCHINDSFSLAEMYEEPKQYDFLYSPEEAEGLIEEIVELVIMELNGGK